MRIIVKFTLFVASFYCASLTAVNAIQIPESLPLTMTFRAADNLKLSSEAFKSRLEELTPYSWIHAPGLDDKVIATRKRWPDKIITIQDAYGGISEGHFSDVWPGHLLYKTRTTLSRDISPQDETILVQDSSRLAKNNITIKSVNNVFPFTLTLYALDDAGNPDWSRSEHVILKGMKKGSLVIQRGQWGTKALAFKAGRAVVAAHMMYWNRQWQLNFSVHSPRGGIGNLTAQEWFARQIAKRVNESKADGVEFDVGRWTWGAPATNPMDVNNDGITDYGYLDGVNSFGLGGQMFFRELRQLLGNDKIIQVDSNGAMYGVRGWKYLNGVQLESFPAANDFDRFSEVFQHLRLWVENAEVLPRISYPFTKTPTTVFANAYLANRTKTDFRFRIGFASACLMGLPHAFASIDNVDFDPANAQLNTKNTKEGFGVFKWDEYHGGDLNDWHWLGRPLGNAQQDLNNVDKTNLVAKTRWKWVADNGFTAEYKQQNGVFSANIKKIPSGVLPETLWYGVRLASKDGGLPTLMQGKEYTVEFDAKGDDTWNYAGQRLDRVPRMITISGTNNASKKKIPLSVLVDSTLRTYRISFIADGSPAPIFGVAEQIGTTEIRNIKLYSGSAERWSREFENGLVLLNMTNSPWHATARKNYYKRLKGTQAPEINNGQPIESEVIVPARDALFLVRRR